ncbi:MAG TPA: hypothetical protein VJN72_09720, partial [Gaiellales bacterium]|nr:hypothetical protein [Gaiellales bacterium]
MSSNRGPLGDAEFEDLTEEAALAGDDRFDPVDPIGEAIAEMVRDHEAAGFEFPEPAPSSRKVRGTIYYDDREGKEAWVVVAEPHVRVWLRRLFPKAARVTKEGLRISASVDRTADLEWATKR